MVRIGGDVSEDVDMGGEGNEVEEALEVLEGADGNGDLDETIQDDSIVKPTFIE